MKGPLKGTAAGIKEAALGIGKASLCLNVSAPSKGSLKIPPALPLSARQKRGRDTCSSSESSRHTCPLLLGGNLQHFLEGKFLNFPGILVSFLHSGTAGALLP